MKAFKIITISTLSILVLAFAGLFLLGYFSPKPGGLRIETTPKATVFINGALVGETPFEGSYKAEQILLRLVPEGSSENLLPYETSIKLSPGIETVVGRTFKVSEAESSSYVISFEKNRLETAAFVAISDPVNSQVLVDGVSRGFSPYDITAISPAMHTITIKSPGYTDFTMTVKTLVGYRLTFFAKLGKASATNTETDNIKATDKIVTILDTPTGYLRVRSKPGKDGEEIAQATSGQTFPYLDTDIETGWIEIQYQAPKTGLPSGIIGWISGDYASVSASTKKDQITVTPL